MYFLCVFFSIKKLLLVPIPKIQYMSMHLLLHLFQAISYGEIRLQNQRDTEAIILLSLSLNLKVLPQRFERYYMKYNKCIGTYRLLNDMVFLHFAGSYTS